LGGIKEIKKLPDAIFFIDPKLERIAVLEARKMGIPVVAVIDTDCDPAMVDYKVPGNDDAIRAIRLFCAIIADAVVEGKAIYERVAGEEGKDGVSGPSEPSAESESAQPQVTEGS